MLPASISFAHCMGFQSQYSGGLYTIKWESELLPNLCNFVQELTLQLGVKGIEEILKLTVAASFLAAIAIPSAVIASLDLIDETWSIIMLRAEEAGIELANCLLENQAGNRPVNLIGFSMGSRIIYSCLLELARHQEIWEDLRSDDKEIKRKNKKNIFEKHKIQYIREPASIIEDVILMGLPKHLTIQSWVICRRIVAGRLVNCFSRNDHVLNLIFQFKRINRLKDKVCGTSQVHVPGVENYDVTKYISSHLDYCLAVNDILKFIKFGQPRLSAYGDFTELHEDQDLPSDNDA